MSAGVVILWSSWCECPFFFFLFECSFCSFLSLNFSIVFFPVFILTCSKKKKSSEQKLKCKSVKDVQSHSSVWPSWVRLCERKRWSANSRLPPPRHRRLHPRSCRRSAACYRAALSSSWASDSVRWPEARSGPPSLSPPPPQKRMTCLHRSSLRCQITWRRTNISFLQTSQTDL